MVVADPVLGPQINIVIPLYNEEEVFEDLTSRLNAVMDDFEGSCSVILIDDGSKDNTEALIRAISQHDPRYTGVILSRNHGHQLALTAGLSYVNATEGVFILDGDLQDPPELLNEFYAVLQDGYDVVYAVRKKRKEGFFKKLAYSAFYKLMRKISYIDLPVDSGDFSLVSRRVVDTLNAMPEQSRYIRGMRSWIGYNQKGVEYERDERQKGDSKYSIKKLFELAFAGIFNFSEYPIKFIIYLGTITMGISGIYLIANLIKRFVYGQVPEGFTGLLLVIIMFGGVQLIAIGLIGEYILRIFFQVKGRPLFLVKDVVGVIADDKK